MALPDQDFKLRSIGFVRSELKSAEDAPKQGYEGAPAAWLEVDKRFREGIEGLAAGAKILVLTWLHLGDREELKTRPGNDLSKPPTGVFATRSPNRPNPIGIHLVKVLEIDAAKGIIQVAPLEAIDGTPIIDLKPYLRDSY
jgi:tRNA-Thr(GGU) m(6)t(6)A37 methyltransferase TsaA